MLFTKSCHKPVRQPLMLALILALVLSGSTVSASGLSTGGTSESLQLTTLHHWGWANPEIAGMVEHSNQALLDVLQRADQALNAQETELAASNLAYADNIALSIELQMPFFVMKERLESAKRNLQMGTNHAFIDQLAPVYASVVDLQLVAPELGHELRDQLQQAQRLAGSGKRDEALQQLDQILDKIVTVRVYVPVLEVKGQIDAARQALQGGDIQVARDKIEQALGSMIAIFRAGNSGL